MSESDRVDSWVVCPYNNNHKMPSSRLQWHLVKCPDKKTKAHLYDTCPYNAQHIVLKSELSRHTLHCEDKNARGNFKHDDIDDKIKEYLATQHKAASNSDWSVGGWNPPPNNPVGFEPADDHDRQPRHPPPRHHPSSADSSYVPPERSVKKKSMDDVPTEEPKPTKMNKIEQNDEWQTVTRKQPKKR